MQRLKKSLAALLAVVMLATSLPVTAMAENLDEIFADEELAAEEIIMEEEAEQSEADADEVIYNLLDMEVTVGSDEEKANDEDLLYFLYDEDGSYTIRLEDNEFFPYEVQFTYNGETWEEWFMHSGDSVEIGGHAFYVVSEHTDPGMLTGLSVKVGDDEIIAWPEEKEFTTEPQMSTFSLLPLREKHLYIDLEGYLPAELSSMSIESLKTLMETEESVAAWAKWGYYDENGDYVYENDDFTVVNEGDTIDLNPGERYRTSFDMELIVGTVDQLNLNNMRYRVDFSVDSVDEMFVAEAATSGDTREVVDVYLAELGQYYLSDDSYRDLLRIVVDPKDWRNEDTYLSLNLNEKYQGLTVSVYEGHYNTEEEIAAAGEAAVEITDQIWAQPDMATEGGYLKNYAYKSGYRDMPEVTVVVKRGENLAMIMPVILYMYRGNMSVEGHYLYAEVDGRREDVWYGRSYSWNDYETTTYTLKQGYSVYDTYYTSLEMYNPADPDNYENNGVEYVKKAVVGYYPSENMIPETAEDIKEALFSDAYDVGSGYAGNFSQPVVFTVIDTNDEIHHYGIQVKEYDGVNSNVTLPEAPTPASQDTYFRMNGAKSLDAYVMPYDADSYYYNGYQTVFLLNEEYDDEIQDWVYNPVTDENIIPRFFTGNKVVMFAGHAGASGVKQVSGETELAFQHGVPVQYSAAAENGADLKNYWVTFLTKQSGPSLFVNATNDESRYVEVPAEAEGESVKIPQREVFLTEEYDNHHDVFFANVGDEDMTGLYVKLENAQNIALDEYWTIGETTTLSAFADLSDRDIEDHYTSYGELKNVAKIRLVPQIVDGVPASGEISGTLIIGYTGEDDVADEEVRIALTGMAGVPKITTESIVDAIKFVPYSSMIQTNNMYGSHDVQFTVINGTLPYGMNLRANGEIYGVPSTTGEFTFTVQAVYYNDPQYSDSKEFTLKILDNTNENVETANSGPQGYPVLDRLPDEVDVATAPEAGFVFRSEGEFNDFVSFYLDGQKLVKDQDFDAEEGSTKITIRAQTFNNIGNGNHTIAAEFRQNGKEDGLMKRSAQNVTVKGATGFVGGGGSSGVAKYSVAIEQADNGTVTSTPKRAEAGDVVKLTITPDEGYVLKSISVMDTKGNEIELTESEGAYLFTMPNRKVEIVPVFVPAQTEEPVIPVEGLPFVDVKEADWFAEGVKYVYEKGLMVGVSADRYAPEQLITDAMVVMVLAKLDNVALENYTENKYSDIMDGQWYTNAAIWAMEIGMLSEGSFSAEPPTTRAELAVALVKYLKQAGVDCKLKEKIVFADADEMSEETLEAFQILYQLGVFAGVGDNCMEPDGATTRAQLAVVLRRVAECVAAAEAE